MRLPGPSWLLKSQAVLTLQERAETLKEQADTAFHHGRYKEAERTYGRCLRLQPGWWQAHGNRSAARLKLNDFEGASEDATQALLSEPNHTRNLGRSAAAL